MKNSKQSNWKIFVLFLILLLQSLTQAEEYRIKNWYYYNLVRLSFLPSLESLAERSLDGFAISFNNPPMSFGIGTFIGEEIYTVKAVEEDSAIFIFPIYFYWVPYLRGKAKHLEEFLEGLDNAVKWASYFYIGFGWSSYPFLYRCGFGVNWEMLGLEIGFLSFINSKPTFFIAFNLGSIFFQIKNL